MRSRIPISQLDKVSKAFNMTQKQMPDWIQRTFHLKKVIVLRHAANLSASSNELFKIRRPIVTVWIFKPSYGAAGRRFISLLPNRPNIIAQPSDFVPNRLRIIKCAHRVGFGVVKGCHTVTVNRQTALFCFRGHPQKGDVGEASSGITAPTLECTPANHTCSSTCPLALALWSQIDG